MILTDVRRDKPLIDPEGYVPPNTVAGKGDTTTAEQAMKDAWCTPRWLLQLACEPLLEKAFDCDPFYSPWGYTHEFMKPGTLQIYCGLEGEKDCGFRNSWDGFQVFCQSPFSMLTQALAKCVETANHPRQPEVVALIEFNEQTQWFQRYVLPTANVIVSLGRVSFVPPPVVAIKKNAPRNSHALIGWNIESWQVAPDRQYPLHELTDLSSIDDVPKHIRNRKLWVVRNGAYDPSQEAANDNASKRTEVA